jgi:hypothetical protein
MLRTIQRPSHIDGLLRSLVKHSGAVPVDADPIASQVRSELLQVIEVLVTRIEHIAIPLSIDPSVPLVIHARYTRVEILAGFDVGQGAKVAPWQTGVYWAPNARSDLLAFTLDKTTGQFSPTTRYL